MKRNGTIARALARISIAVLATLLLVAPASANQAAAHRKNDRDRMPNGWEKKNGLDVQRNDAREDPDADLLLNIAEFKNKTDPQDDDSDDDGFTDGDEVLDGTDPADAEDNLDADEDEGVDDEVDADDDADVDDEVDADDEVDLAYDR